jgi:uncharacterized protein YkwD
MCTRGYFDHTSPDGETPSERLLGAGLTPLRMGENIAAGYSTATAVVAGWMDSTGHRANILNSDFGQMGLGRASCPGGSFCVYWTQVFTD